MSKGRTIEKLNDPFSIFIKILNAIGCGLTMFLMVIIMIDVCGRTFFNSPITGVPEFVVALITIIAFLQLTYVQMIDKHMKVTIFSDNFSPKVQRGLQLFSQLFGIAVFVFMILSTYDDLVYSITTREMEGEGALVLPMWPVRGTIFFCSCVVLIIMIRQAFWLLQKKNVYGEKSEG